jgi:regulator of protease activity HflC (stomatin/prohibitin superfamily)
MFNPSILSGLGIVFSICFLGYWLFNKMTEQVDDETETFILIMGQVKKTLKTPGLHFMPEKVLPWVQAINISKQIDYKNFKNIQVSDHYGTTVIIDLWVEFRISDPYKALFSVENWEEVMESLVIHTTASILCSQTIDEILKHRSELAEQLRIAMIQETERWGITISGAMIQNVGLLPEISKQFFNSVAARIERTKAVIEEEGRIRVAKLEANTHFKVAELNSLAKLQLPIAIGAAYGNLSAEPEVLRGFQKYWELNHLDPRKTVIFNGFKSGTLDVAESVAAVESILSR